MKIVKYSRAKEEYISSGSYTGSESSGSGSGSSGSGSSSLVNDWFYIDTQGVVHCRYNFAGDGEVSAFADVSAGPSAMYAQMKETLATIDSSSSLQDVIEVLTELKEIL